MPAPLPFVVGVGTKNGSTTTNAAFTFPSHQAGDILLILVESANEVVTLATGLEQGFTSVGAAGNGTAGNSASTRVTAFWKRCTSGSETVPTLADPGDHTGAIAICIRGCVESGDPFNVTSGNGGASNTAVTIPGAVTTVANCLVLAICARNQDDASAGYFSGWTNSDLANITEIFDEGWTAGNGGGLGVITGEKPSAGSYGSTTATISSASTQGRLTIAFMPPQAQSDTPNTATTTVTAQQPTATLGAVAGTPNATAITFSGQQATGSLSASNQSGTPNIASPVVTAQQPSATLGSVSGTPSSSVVSVSGQQATGTPAALSVAPNTAVAQLLVNQPSATIGAISGTPGSATVTVTSPQPTATLSGVTGTPSTAIIGVAVEQPTGTLSGGPQTVTPGSAIWQTVAEQPAVTLGATSATPDTAVIQWTGGQPSGTSSGIASTPETAVLELVAPQPTVTLGEASGIPATAGISWVANQATGTIGIVVVVTPLAGGSVSLPGHRAAGVIASRSGSLLSQRSARL